jgi:2Fe-2S ferredoxin
MVKIVIENLGVKEVVTNDVSKSVMAILHTHFIDWMHACGGKGRCTTCKMIVKKGGENLSQPTAAERKYQRDGTLVHGERLACQSKLVGDITIRVPEENKLPHVVYGQ